MLLLLFVVDGVCVAFRCERGENPKNWFSIIGIIDEMHWLTKRKMQQLHGNWGKLRNEFDFTRLVRRFQLKWDRCLPYGYPASRLCHRMLVAELAFGSGKRQHVDTAHKNAFNSRIKWKNVTVSCRIHTSWSHFNVSILVVFVSFCLIFSLGHHILFCVVTS